MFVLRHLFSTFRFQCGCILHQLGLNNFGLYLFNPLEHTSGRNMCLLVLVHGPCQEYMSSWYLPLLQEGGCLMLLKLLPQPFNQYGGVYNFGDLAESPDPSTFPTYWGGVFFLRFDTA